MPRGFLYLLLSLSSLPFAVSLAPSTQLGHVPHVHPLTTWAETIHSLQVDLLPAVKVETNCSSLAGAEVWCSVSWSGVLFPSEDDLVALYVPATADPKTVVPVKYAKAAASSSHLTEGIGSSSFHLINLRQSMGFKFIKHGFIKPVVIGASPAIRNLNPLQPSQGHLAVHQDSRHIVVQWVSGSSEPQEVQYSLAASPRTAAGPPPPRASAPSRSHTYSKEHMCGFPADSVGWMDPGHIHTASFVLDEDLEPNQVVEYRYGSEAVGWSGARSFRVAPRPGVLTDPPLVFLVFNDVAMSNSLLFNSHCPPWCPGGLNFNPYYGVNSTKLPRFLEQEGEAHVALLMGDLSYALGFAADWDFFGAQFERSFTQWPLAVAMGNHERDWPNTGDSFQDTALDSGGECGVPTVQRYSTPGSPSPGLAAPQGPGAGAAGPSPPAALFYSFSRGSVHFLVLDSEMPSDPDSEQGRFVLSDLRSVDRNSTPWVVVGFHRMMWAPASWSCPLVGDMENMQRLQEDLEELFMEYEVDVVVQGHEHAYARSCPLYKGTCVDTTQTHGRGGGGGSHVDSSVPSSRRSRSRSRGRSLLRDPSSSSSSLLGPLGPRARVRRGAPGGGWGAPVYVLAGHAGAGFTHGFPKKLPDWVVAAFEERNGYLRFTASFTSLTMEAVSTDDGSVMDLMQLNRP